MHLKLCEKNRLEASTLCIENHQGKGSLASPWARSASLIEWTLAVGLDGIAEFLWKNGCQQMVTLARTVRHAPLVPSIISTDMVPSIILDFLLYSTCMGELLVCPVCLHKEGTVERKVPQCALERVRKYDSCLL